jgi:hypothetical protein
MQFIEQRLRFLQVACVEALGEPAVRVAAIHRIDLKHLIGRFTSGAWWLLVATSSQAAVLLEEIERRFYAGSANGDFELAIIPSQLGCPMAIVVSACKRRLPARRLLCILARFMRPEEVAVARGGLAAWRDVLVLDAEGPTNGRA